MIRLFLKNLIELNRKIVLRCLFKGYSLKSSIYLFQSVLDRVDRFSSLTMNAVSLVNLGNSYFFTFGSSFSFSFKSSHFLLLQFMTIIETAFTS